MVDVMLVMLIIFMVITPKLSKGKDVDMVKTKNAIAMQAADKSDAMVCAVTRDGKTFLGTTATAARRSAEQSERFAGQPPGQDGFREGRRASAVRACSRRGGQSACRGRGPMGLLTDQKEPGKMEGDSPRGCQVVEERFLKEQSYVNVRWRAWWWP
jgi:hypothetical protein